MFPFDDVIMYGVYEGREFDELCLNNEKKNRMNLLQMNGTRRS